MAATAMNYAPRASTAPPVYWRPGAMGLPAVSYPTPTGAATSSPRARSSPMQVQRGPAPPPSISPEQAFGVNTGSFAATTGWNNAGPLTQIPYITRNVPVGGAAGGGAGGGGGINDLITAYQQQLNQANQANEARYQDVLGGYQQRYERGLGMLQGLGQQEARDINELYDKNAAATQQRLIDRGLLSSSVTDTMLAGNDRERTADLGRLNDRVRQQALTADAGLSGDTLQFMERKTDQAPDVNLLAQLAAQLGQGGVGGGGYGAPIMNTGMYGGMQSYNPYAGYGQQMTFQGGAGYSGRTQARMNTRAAQRESEIDRRKASRMSIPSAPRSSPWPAWMTDYEYTPGVAVAPTIVGGMF